MNHINPTQAFVATIALLMQKYKKLDEDAKNKNNILVARLIEINRLSTIVSQITDTVDTSVVEASLIINNSGLSFKTKNKKLTEIKTRLENIHNKFTPQQIAFAIKQQQRQDNIQLEDGQLEDGQQQDGQQQDDDSSPQQYASPEIKIRKQKRKIAKSIVNNAIPFETATKESIQAIFDIGSEPTTSKLKKIYNKIIILGTEQLDLDKKQQQIFNWLKPKQSGGSLKGGSPQPEQKSEQSGGAPQQQQQQQPQQQPQQNMYEFADLVIELQLEAAAVTASIKQHHEYINNKLQKYGTDETLQKMSYATAIMVDQAEIVEDEILNAMVSAMQYYATTLSESKTKIDNNATITDLNKEYFKTSNELAQQNKVITKNNESLQNNTDEATKKANTFNLLAMDSILSNTLDIFASGAHFAKSEQSSEQALGTSDKKGIESAHNSTKELSGDVIKNMLVAVGENHENIDKLVNGGVVGAANVLYTFASTNKNENAGKYASMLSGEPEIANPLPIIVAARMAGTMYAINKNVSQEKCGNVATEAIIGFLKAIAIDHLMAPAVAPAGDYLNYSIMGVPSYPNAKPADLGNKPNGAHSVFTVGAQKVSNQQVAENIASIIAELIANGKNTAAIVAAAKAVAGVSNEDHPRIDYVVRELSDNSKYLEHIVPEQAAGARMIPNAAGVPAGAATNEDAIDGGIYRGGAIAGVRVIDNDVYYTVINVATSVYTSTGDEQKATNAGIAVGKLMVMYKYGHRDLIRVQSQVAAYIGIYIAIALAVHDKSVSIAAKTGFIFGQGWEHHENVRQSIQAIFNAPDRLAIYNPADYVVTDWAAAAADGVGPDGATNHRVGAFINRENAKPGDQLEHAAVMSKLENDADNTASLNDAFLNAPLLFRTVITAFNIIKQKKLMAVDGAGDIEQYEVYPKHPPDAADFNIAAGTAAKALSKADQKQLIASCTDAYETAKSAANPMDVSNIRIAFKLFCKIVSVGTAGVAQTIPIIDSNNKSPYSKNAGLAVVEPPGVKIMLTPRVPADPPPFLLTNNRIDTVSDLLFSPPPKNNIAYYEIRSPNGPDPEYANLALTDEEIDKIQNFVAMRVTEWIQQSVAPAKIILPILNTNNFQYDIYQFSAMNVTKKCQYSLAAVRNYHNYKTLYLNNNTTNDVKYPIDLTPEIIKKAGLVKPNFGKAVDNLENYTTLIKKTIDTIEPPKKNVINAIYSSANAVLQILKTSTDIIGVDVSNEAITNGIVAKDIANKEINVALDEILAAYTTVKVQAFGQVSLEDGTQLMDTLKKIITEIKNEPDIQKKVIKASELVPLAEFAANAYREFDPKKCLILTDAEAKLVQIVAPTKEYQQLDMILSAAIAVSSAIKTVALSNEILFTGSLKKNMSRVDNSQLTADRSKMDDAMTDMKKRLEKLNKDDKNSADANTDKALLEMQTRRLLKQLTEQYNHQQQNYRQYRQYSLRVRDNTNYDNFHDKAKNQYKELNATFETTRKMVSTIIITYIKLLATTN